MCSAPNSAAALVGPAPPPGEKSCSEPIGARMTGRRTSWPSTLARVLTFSTLRSTRGRKAMASSARRLRSSVVSVSAPPIR